MCRTTPSPRGAAARLPSSRPASDYPFPELSAPVSSQARPGALRRRHPPRSSSVISTSGRSATNRRCRAAVDETSRSCSLAIAACARLAAHPEPSFMRSSRGRVDRRSSTQVPRPLGPRINAAGRLGHPRSATRAVLTDYPPSEAPRERSRGPDRRGGDRQGGSRRALPRGRCAC